MFYTKLNRRIELFQSWNWGDCSKEEFKRDISKGRYPWIRTTGRPCNCCSCTYKKYKRLSKSEIKKIIDEQIQITALVV